MKRKNIKILICSHKNVKLPTNEFFFPIQAGAYNSIPILNYEKDNTGFNISERNTNYCELTCHYWAWKNFKDVDIIGLNHYRRYFDFEQKNAYLAPDRKFVFVDSFLAKPYIFPNMDNIFNKYDIILPSTRNYPFNMATQYLIFHIIEDWNILKGVIGELSPEYIPAFEKTMERRNFSSNYNMFITKWKYFDEYSEWLFKILFEVEKRCKISEYPVQARIFGYMSERLINVYCEYRHLKIMHVPLIVPIDNFSPDMNPGYLQYNWWKFRNNLAYYISKL